MAPDMKCSEQVTPQRQTTNLAFPAAGVRDNEAGLLVDTGFPFGVMKCPGTCLARVRAGVYP
jgi:hypothetical protein